MQQKTTPAQQALLDARAVASRVEQEDLRKTLLAGIDTAIMQSNSAKIVDEGKKLVAYWRTMPEHITGSTAIRHLETVLNGGGAPNPAGYQKPIA
jgi:hypothetical protein